MSPLAAATLDEGRSFTDWSDLVIGVTCMAIALFGAGWVAHERYEARKPAPAPLIYVEAKPAALAQWSCSKQEFREHRNTCATRERMGKVK